MRWLASVDESLVVRVGKHGAFISPLSASVDPPRARTRSILCRRSVHAARDAAFRRRRARVDPVEQRFERRVVDLHVLRSVRRSLRQLEGATVETLVEHAQPAAVEAPWTPPPESWPRPAPPGWPPPEAVRRGSRAGLSASPPTLGRAAPAPPAAAGGVPAVESVLMPHPLPRKATPQRRRGQLVQRRRPRRRRLALATASSAGAAAHHARRTDRLGQRAPAPPAGGGTRSISCRPAGPGQDHPLALGMHAERLAAHLARQVERRPSARRAAPAPGRWPPPAPSSVRSTSGAAPKKRSAGTRPSIP